MARSVSAATRSRKPGQPPPRGKVLTPSQACEVLGVSYRTLKRIVADGRVSFTRLPGSNRLRFFEGDLIRALEDGRVEAVSE